MDVVSPTEPLDVLERRRDALALDVRSDPDLREDLEALENEIAARRVADERELAAGREAERRDAEIALQAAKDERAQQVRRYRACVKRRRKTATAVDAGLDVLIEAMKADAAAGVEMAGIASQLGISGDYLGDRQRAWHVQHRLAMETDRRAFGDPIASDQRWAPPLVELLSLPNHPDLPPEEDPHA